MKFSARLQTLWSLVDIDGSADEASCANLSKSNASGGFRIFHMSSILRSLSMSSLKTLSNTFRAKSAEPMESLIVFKACDSRRRFSISFATHQLAPRTTQSCSANLTILRVCRVIQLWRIIIAGTKDFPVEHERAGSRLRGDTHT